MKRGPLVSVCVPTIGRRDTLSETLHSLGAQTYANYEALILDNASPGEAQAEIAEFAKSNSRATVLRSEVRLPMFANFQRGIDAAAGPYVAFLHDDDVYAPDFLAEQISLLEANPTVAFAGSNCYLIDAEGKVTDKRDFIRNTERWDGWRYIEALFALGNNIFPMQSIVYRRSCLAADTFAAVEGVHYSDFVLLMRLAEMHDVGVNAHRLLRLRVHTDQASQQVRIQEALRLRTEIFCRYCDELEVRWPSRRQQIEGLRRRVARARRTAALWSWINARDRPSAEESLAAMGTGTGNRALAVGLGVLDRAGLSRLVRARALRRKLRATAQFAVRAASSGRGR